MRKLIKNVKIVDGGTITPGSILIREGTVLDILVPDAVCEGAETVDGNGLYASAGFIDLHTHGAGGADFMDGTGEAFLTACRTHLAHGTTTIFPTTLAAAREETARSIEAFKAAKEALNRDQFVPGLHLEGPYLSMERRGAQDPRCVRDPDPGEYRELVENADGAVLRWTAAPERRGAMELGDYLSENGILPSIGHSGATYEEVKEAIRHGYRHITHLYNCTGSIVRKDGFKILGVTESAYCFDELTVELIADGCHVPPELIAMTVKCKGADRIALVTDSLRPAGTDALESTIGSAGRGRRIIIEDGVAKLPDRSTLAGSVATADRLVQTVWKQAGVPLYDAIRMMSENPARIMRIDGRKGRLLPGKDADIVLFDEDVQVRGVYYMGRKVF